MLPATFFLGGGEPHATIQEDDCVIYNFLEKQTIPNIFSQVNLLF